MNWIKIIETANQHLYIVNLIEGLLSGWVSLGHCAVCRFFLFSFDLRFQITPLVSSNSSFKVNCLRIELDHRSGFDIKLPFPLNVDIFFPLQSTGHLHGLTMFKEKSGNYLSFRIIWVQLCCIGIHVAHLFSFVCCVLFCLFRSVSCVQCCLFFWIVHFSLPLRFTF